MAFPMLANLAGGIGLFILGMHLMTGGLKFAAGHTLRTILTRSTSTPLRGLLTGALITSLVQSSSAVTVAVIGFVNAGLLELGQAILLTYGSNIGTTMTGWLVALVGFDVNIKAFALPGIGFGMLLRFIGRHQRLSGVGDALAGFGLFFLGIDFLKTSFAGTENIVPLTALAGNDFGSLLLFVATGFLLTFFMQSSSAAMVITMTAATAGTIPLTNAIAMVIGTNVGTTTTAALATLDATPNAKRVAAAHLLFNLAAGLVALLILPLLLLVLTTLNQSLDFAASTATLLALFHTTFNVLGVLLMLPFTGRLVTFLQQRFRGGEEDEGLPRYLDRNVVATPTLAMRAMAMELSRIGHLARRMAMSAISSEAGVVKSQLLQEKTALDSLVDAVGEFSTIMQRQKLPPDLDDQLPNGLRVSRYYTETAELALVVEKIQGRGQTLLEEGELADAVAHFKGQVVQLLAYADVTSEDYSMENCQARLTALNDEYQKLKGALLRAGTTGVLQVRKMVSNLELLSDIRRIADQVEKGALFLGGLSSFRETSRDNIGDQEP